MRVFPLILLGITLLACIAFLPAQAPPDEDASLAIVTMITGHVVKVDGETKEKTDLPLFGLLRQADQVKTDRGASVKIAFFSGEACLIAEKSHAVITRAGVTMKKGKVQHLGRLDALPELQPIASRERPGLNMTGFKVRSATERPPLMLLASRPVIAISPVAETEKYHFSIRSAGGGEVFCCTTSGTSIEVPAGVLEPEQDYRLEVAAERGGQRQFVLRDHPLRTISAADAKARDALLAKFQTSGDVSWLLLLVEIDWRLGLEVEACREYLQAARLTPGNPAVQELGGRLGCEE